MPRNEMNDQTRRIAELLAQGLSRREIGEAIGVSGVRVTQIVGNHPELIRYQRRNGQTAARLYAYRQDLSAAPAEPADTLSVDDLRTYYAAFNFPPLPDEDGDVIQHSEATWARLVPTIVERVEVLGPQDLKFYLTPTAEKYRLPYVLAASVETVGGEGLEPPTSSV